MLFSDSVRLAHLRSGIGQKVDTTTPALDEMNAGNDYIVVKNLGNGNICYYERWLGPCWAALRAKKEYRGMSKTDAMKKFIRNRFANVVAAVGGRIVSWKLTRNNVLVVQIALTAESAEL